MQGLITTPFLGQFPSIQGSGVIPVTPGGWSPVTLTNGDGTAITIGMVCYLSAANTARKAIANGTEAQASAVVMCIDTSVAAGASGRFVWGGNVAGLSGGVAGALGYLSTTAGTVQNTPYLTSPGYNVLLGMWQSTTVFNFNWQFPIAN